MWQPLIRNELSGSITAEVLPIQRGNHSSFKRSINVEYAILWESPAIISHRDLWFTADFWNLAGISKKCLNLPDKSQISWFTFYCGRRRETFRLFFHSLSFKRLWMLNWNLILIGGNNIQFMGIAWIIDDYYCSSIIHKIKMGVWQILISLKHWVQSYPVKLWWVWQSNGEVISLTSQC